ncbi:Acyl-CoA N-acyltransferases (NAT) superfamily protein [Thalictrum thalictroides]|uniref:Acyl-CoA N-acyltransferases (NAT) superfamily protein n=1 Tax=Thalictrum thalictroides TaxID=46969 RepID=A0A7J6XE99_THATH|nr:Acyl-CoA N-acyltransferases (NAT) superfamily protein [Thalictrum thalictroides]
MANKEIKIRSYVRQIDRIRIEDLERRCAVGMSKNTFLFTDTMGDPICRIRHSPLYNMLVAEADNELVGVIQGSIKIVTIDCSTQDRASVGYILGLRVSPLHRRKGIGSILVRTMEEWFIANNAEFAYMATEKNNEASVKLFINKHGFVKFREPAILVNPVGNRTLHISSKVEILKLKTEQAEYLYRRFMASTEFFPHDIDRILTNKLSLGTWIAYPRGESWSTVFEPDRHLPTSWAMVSIWNSVELFKLRVGKASMSCLMSAKSSKFVERIFPCLNLPIIPDFIQPFGFYFMFGLYGEGLRSHILLRSLCRFVHNLATQCKDCKVIVTEVGEGDILRSHIPHSRLLSFPDDLWCIKALKKDRASTSFELTRAPSLKSIFVDPREV